MNEPITISLPSLIHRIGRESVNRAKVIATQHRCELKRVRRSRNWALSGEASLIQSFVEQLKAVLLAESEFKPSNESTLRYLIQKVETTLIDHADKLEPLGLKLIRLINENPNITLAELIHVTNCSMSDARTARFDADAW